jgi:glutathionylspermidine synthase
MTAPWLAVTPLGDEAYRRIRRRAIFECFKWDPQVEDTATLAPFPLVLRASAWRELAMLAEALARETVAAEAELLERPELHSALALPRRVRSALRQRSSPTTGAARLIRFDFHHTTEGWRLSEANTDVPGGLNEASGFATLIAAAYPSVDTVGDVALDYARALLRPAPTGHVALVHATSYTDDHQVMAYVARHIQALGGRAALVSPAQIRWESGQAYVLRESSKAAVHVLARFFPAEWLEDLPRACTWERWFRGGVTPTSNPASALLTQSKRLPLVWDRLRTAMPTWRTLLPETRDPRDVPWRASDEWLLKPALGRVGDGIGMRGVTPTREWRLIARAARWRPREWIAQRRFEAVAFAPDGAPTYPCIGVYTIDGRAAGAYGRIASRPLVDWRARDIAVLVDREAASDQLRRPA